MEVLTGCGFLPVPPRAGCVQTEVEDQLKASLLPISTHLQFVNQIH